MPRGKRSRELEETTEKEEAADPTYVENEKNEGVKKSRRKKYCCSSECNHKDNFDCICYFLNQGILHVGQKVKVEYNFSKRCSTEIDFMLLANGNFSHGDDATINTSMTTYISQLLKELYTQHPIMKAVSAMGYRVPRTGSMHSFVSDCKFAFSFSDEGRTACSNTNNVFWISIDTLGAAFYEDNNELKKLFENGNILPIYHECTTYECNDDDDSGAFVDDTQQDDDEDNIFSDITMSPHEDDLTSNILFFDAVKSSHFGEQSAFLYNEHDSDESLISTSFCSTV